MYVVVHRPEDGGIPFKMLKGTTAEEAADMILSAYGDGYICTEVERRLGENEKLDLTGEEVAIVPHVPVKTPSELQAEIIAAVGARLDAFAQQRMYDNILSAATYATSPVPQFQVEGQRAVELRDQTWAVLYQMLAEVQAGTRPMPSAFADIESELPALIWP